MKNLCSLWGSFAMALMFISFVTYGIFPPSRIIVLVFAVAGLAFSIYALKKDKETEKKDRNQYYVGIIFNAMAVFWTALSPFIRELLFSKGGN